LVVLGLSLIPVLFSQSHEFVDPFVSWLRLVQTASGAWPYLVERQSDRSFVVGTVAAACAIELVRAVIVAAALHRLSGRIEDGNGPDTEGLLAAVLIVTVLYGGVTQRKIHADFNRHERLLLGGRYPHVGHVPMFRHGPARRQVGVLCRRNVTMRNTTAETSRPATTRAAKSEPPTPVRPYRGPEGRVRRGPIRWGRSSTLVNQRPDQERSAG